jgi:integrase
LVYISRARGVCKRHPFSTLSEVRLIEATLKERSSVGKEMRLVALFRLYTEYLEAKGSIAKDSARMATEMVEYFGNIPMAYLKRQMVLEYRTHLNKRPPRYGKKVSISNRTVNAYMQTGRAAYNYADPGGYNPFRALGRLPETQIEEYLSEEEEFRLIATARKQALWLWQFIVISLGTGLRRSNVLNLRRSEVDFERKTISVIQKGRRRFTTRLDEMTELVLKSIPQNGSDYFIVNPKTHGPYTSIRPAFIKCQQMAEIKKPIRIHGLRHQVGHKLARQGKNLKQIMEVLGHTQPSATVRYLALSPADVGQLKKDLEIPSVMAELRLET